MIEQSDELDRCNVELDLIKQIKHHCLAGDIGKVSRICSQFQEQSEQLVEICKMLNQIAPTHKIKITTKALAIWFELNLSNILSIVECLAQNPRSKVAKDCTWAYIQGEYFYAIIYCFRANTQLQVSFLPPELVSYL